MSRILFIDQQGLKALPDRNQVDELFHKYDLSYVSSTKAGRLIVENQGVDVVISNHPDFTFFSYLREKHPSTHIILVTELPMKDYSEALNGEEEILIDHVISLKSQGFWTIQELRVTVSKVLNPSDIFGIEKYLLPGTKIEKRPITGSKDRETLNDSVIKFATSCRLGQHLSKMAFGITEELLMNTIHDAPLAAGIMHYSEQPRTAPVSLKPEEFGELSYGCDGRVLAISASDPFGALKKQKLFQYLKKVLRRKDSVGLIDTKKEGAGLGFFKILYSSHAIVCNVKPNSQTEIMSLINVNEQLRDFSSMPRSIHFFSSTDAVSKVG